MATDAPIIETALGPVQCVDTGGDGPPVLFVHGTPGGADQGALMGRFLVDAGCRVVAPSRPGYLGTPLAGRRTPADHAALHAALLDALALDRVAVACWSGGGPSSYRLVIDHPERITAFVGIAAVSEPYTFEHPSEETILFGRPGAWLMKELTKHAPKSAVKALVTEEGDLPKDQARELVHAIWDDPARREWVLEWAGTVTGSRRDGFDNDRHQFPEIDLDLTSVTAPVLLVHADTDSDVPYHHSLHAAGAIPGACLHTITGGTHISLWTGPDDDAARASVTDFLRASAA